MARLSEWLTIGQSAKRSGMAASALRFYEQKELIASSRNSGNQRLIHRSMLRRIALIKVGQNLGFSLGDIQEYLNALPSDGVPTHKHWNRLGKMWRESIQDRIARLEQLRDQLDQCIGCGCLSLNKCRLYNPDDSMGANSSGAVFLD